jgi:hypothetical protein
VNGDLDYDSVAADYRDFDRLKTMVHELIKQEHSEGARSIYLQGVMVMVTRMYEGEFGVVE